jgi:hypothetical protein
MKRSCQEVTRLVSEGQDRKLGFAERMVLRAHLAICRGCANFEAQIGFLRRAMQRLSEQDDGKGR